MEVLKGNSNVRVVSWEDWKVIDRVEIERG